MRMASYRVHGRDAPQAEHACSEAPVHKPLVCPPRVGDTALPETLNTQCEHIPALGRKQKRTEKLGGLGLELQACKPALWAAGARMQSRVMGQSSGAVERGARYPAHTLLRAVPGPCSLPLAQKASHILSPTPATAAVAPQRRSEALPVPGTGAGGTKKQVLAVQQLRCPTQGLVTR